MTSFTYVHMFHDGFNTGKSSLLRIGETPCRVYNISACFFLLAKSAYKFLSLDLTITVNAGILAFSVALQFS